MSALDIKETEVLFADALDNSKYNELTSLIETQSCESKWSDFSKLHMEPYWNEKHEFEEEPWVNIGKEFKHYFHQLDFNNRIIYVQHKTQFPSGINVDETFAIYSDESVIFYAYENSFCGGLRLLWVRHGKFENGQLIEVNNISSEGQTSKETFSYTLDQLVNSFYIQEERKYNGGNLPLKAGFRWATKYNYLYDVHGNINKIVRNAINLQNNDIGDNWVVYGDSEL